MGIIFLDLEASFARWQRWSRTSGVKHIWDRFWTEWPRYTDCNGNAVTWLSKQQVLLLAHCREKNRRLLDLSENSTAVCYRVTIVKLKWQHQKRVKQEEQVSLVPNYLRAVEMGSKLHDW